MSMKPKRAVRKFKLRRGPAKHLRKVKTQPPQHNTPIPYWGRRARNSTNKKITPRSQP